MFKYMFFLLLITLYCPYLKCSICASIIHLVSIRGWILLCIKYPLDSHLLAYENVFVAWETIAFVYSFSIYLLRFHTDPS